MRLINVKTLKLVTFASDKIPPYAILSHTWGKDEDEVSFRDIQTGNIEKPGKMKLERCCEQANKDGLGYAWIDTCCINKDSSRELDEAINSMLKWYEKASICYVYLSDVPFGENSWDPKSKFFSSRWFRRGWTLQELLAPDELHFYDQIWTFIGTKSDFRSEIETITGIPGRFLLGWQDFRKASVAQRMSWAANRDTTRKEDIAYCLLGIFQVSIQITYGGDGGDQAFSRLEEEIMRKTGDDSILAWGLNPTEFIPGNATDVISAGILASAPSDFVNCGNIVPREQGTTPLNTFDISSGRLRVHLSLHKTSAGEIYGLLNCGPEADTDQVVGIPLHKTVSSAESDEYLRPQGRYSVLLPKIISILSTKAIHIRIERESRVHEATSRRYWLYLDVHQKINLKLSDVHPPVSWEKGRALIATANDSDGNITRQYLARFHIQGERSRDFIVVLEFEIRRLQAQARCHVLTSSRDPTLEELSKKLIYMRPEAFGRQTASHGNLNIRVTVTEEYITQDPMFVVRITQASSSLESTVDATLELQQVDLKRRFMRILQEEDQIRAQAERLDRQREEKKGTLDSMSEALRKSCEEQRLPMEGLEKARHEMDQLTIRGNEIRQHQDKLSELRSEIQQGLDQLDTKQGPGNWLETMIKTLLDAGKIDRDLRDIGDSDSGCLQLSTAVGSGHNIDRQTPLSWAAQNGLELVAKLLLEKGASLESKNNDGRTPLMCATYNGHETIAKLLLEKGADFETKDKNGNTPLMLAISNGHEAAAKLLLKKGADFKVKTQYGWTLLLGAASNGHEAMVKLLLEKSVDLESKDENGNTPLMLAANNGYEAVVKLLLKKGADFNAKDENGNTSLMLAVSNGNEAVTNILLEKGANLESKNNNDGTPLMCAVYNGHKAMAKLLLEKGANFNAKDKNGNTLLILAAFNGHEAMTKFLLKKGANLELKNKNAYTPLMLAISNGHEAAAKLLLEKGADFKTKDKNGNTPLMLAISNKHEALTKLLLEKGAKFEAGDKLTIRR